MKNKKSPLVDDAPFFQPSYGEGWENSKVVNRLLQAYHHVIRQEYPKAFPKGKLYTHNVPVSDQGDASDVVVTSQKSISKGLDPSKVQHAVEVKTTESSFFKQVSYGSGELVARSSEVTVNAGAHARARGEEAASQVKALYGQGHVSSVIVQVAEADYDRNKRDGSIKVVPLNRADAFIGTARNQNRRGAEIAFASVHGAQMMTTATYARGTGEADGNKRAISQDENLKLAMEAFLAVGKASGGNITLRDVNTADSLHSNDYVEGDYRKRGPNPNAVRFSTQDLYEASGGAVALSVFGKSFVVRESSMVKALTSNDQFKEAAIRGYLAERFQRERLLKGGKDASSISLRSLAKRPSRGKPGFDGVTFSSEKSAVAANEHKHSAFHADSATVHILDDFASIRKGSYNIETGVVRSLIGGKLLDTPGMFYDKKLPTSVGPRGGLRFTNKQGKIDWISKYDAAPEE